MNAAKKIVFTNEVIIGRVEKITLDRPDTSSNQKFLKGIILQQKILNENFQKAIESKDSLLYWKTFKELGDYRNQHYEPNINVLSDYFCVKKDTLILRLFLSSMWADRGSASETSSITLGNCFVCQPELVLEKIIKKWNVKQLDFFYESIDWGLKNIFVEEDHLTLKKEYYPLKKKLDDAIKKANP
jgi:hypothetical protein